MEVEKLQRLVQSEAGLSVEYRDLAYDAPPHSASAPHLCLLASTPNG